MAEEALSNAALVQASNAETRELARFRRENEGAIAAELAGARIAGIFAPVVDLIQLAGALLMIALGTWAIAAGDLTVGGMLAFLAYLAQMYRPVRDLSSLASSVFEAVAGAERVIEVLDAKPAVEEAPDARPLPAAPRRLELEGVAYAYPGAVARRSGRWCAPAAARGSRARTAAWRTRAGRRSRAGCGRARWRTGAGAQSSSSPPSSSSPSSSSSPPGGGTTGGGAVGTGAGAAGGGCAGRLGRGVGAGRAGRGRAGVRGAGAGAGCAGVGVGTLGRGDCRRGGRAGARSRRRGLRRSRAFGGLGVGVALGSGRSSITSMGRSAVRSKARGTSRRSASAATAATAMTIFCGFMGASRGHASPPP